MMSIEEKQALLVKKWEAMHPKKDATKTKSRTYSAIVPGKVVTDKNISSLASSIWEASGRDLKSIVPPGVKNQSWYLLNLIGVIDWYGNVAVGRDKYFEGWWNVVPPTGCTISYFGPGAEQRSREMAEKITGYYP
jgi:hypothetical protein